MRGKRSWLNNPSHDFPVWYHCISKRKDRQRCMAAFFGWKMGKQKIRKWRNIKTAFLARTPANLKHKTVHVLFTTKVIFIKFNPLSCIFCLFVLIICLWVCSSHACLQIRVKAFLPFFHSCVYFGHLSYLIYSTADYSAHFFLGMTGSRVRPCVRPCDFTSSACEGCALAMSCRGRQQSCLGFPWQLKDIQLLHIPLLNSIQIVWNPALLLRLSLANSCPPRSTAVSAFIEGSWIMCFLWASSVWAFVCTGCVFCFYSRCFLCL